MGRRPAVTGVTVTACPDHHQLSFSAHSLPDSVQIASAQKDLSQRILFVTKMKSSSRYNWPKGGETLQIKRSRNFFDS